MAAPVTLIQSQLSSDSSQGTASLSLRSSIKYVSHPPRWLLCPVCNQLLLEPVIAVGCGHTFCRNCSEQLKEANRSCPLDNTPSGSNHFVPNRALGAQIDELEVHCPNSGEQNDSATNTAAGEDGDRSSGCNETMKLSELSEHLAACPFGLVSCPQAGEVCGQILRKDLVHHLEVCQRCSCINSAVGCLYQGTREQVEEHQKECPNKEAGESHSLQTLTQEVHSLKIANKLLQEKVDHLLTEKARMEARVEKEALTVAGLSSRVEALEGSLKQLKYMSTSPGLPETGHGGTPVVRRRRESTSRRSNGGQRWSRESASGSTAVLPSLAESRKNGMDITWQMPFTLKCIGTFRGHEHTVWSLATHADRLYSSCSGGEIKMWNISDSSRGCIKSIRMHSTYVMCMEVGNGLLFSADYEGNLRSWMLDSLEVVGSVKAHDDVVSSMATAGRFLFSGCLGIVKVWDAVTLTEVHSFTNLLQWVRALTYDRHKGYMYAAVHKKVNVWKVKENFEMITTELETDHGAIYSLAVSSKNLFIGTQNQNIHIYDVGTHKYIRSLSGHISTVTCLLITPCERVLFSSSRDSTIQVWNLENTLPIQCLQRHEKCVNALAMWKDTLYSGSEDTEIKLFKPFKL